MIDETRPRSDSCAERDDEKWANFRKGLFRFNVGDTVWIRDTHRGGGYRIVQATVRDQHYHPGRAPFYPLGEGYAFNDSRVEGEVPEAKKNHTYWDCYPGMRVFATRAEAIAARMTPEFALEMHNAACRRIRSLEAAA